MAGKRWVPDIVASANTTDLESHPAKAFNSVSDVDGSGMIWLISLARSCNLY